MKKCLFSIILLVSILLSSCSTNVEPHTNATIVHTTPVQTQEYETGLDYLGLVTAQDTKRYSFLMGGRIEEIYVQEGDVVAAGAPLAKLDTTQLELTVSTSSNSIHIAENSIATLTESLNAAQAALDSTQLNLERYQTLYEAGAASSVEVENLELQLESQRATYTQIEQELASAQFSLSNSKLAQQQAQKNLDDATLVADYDGIVMELPYKPGEVVGSGYPVVIMKSSSKIVTVGVSSDDIGKVDYNSTIRINGEMIGKVEQISQYPDESLRAYPVDISLDTEQYAIGDMVNVRIITGTAQASFVPVQSIFNLDGLDYVYIVGDDGIVSRHQVFRQSVSEDMVGVNGLEDGMSVISDGIKDIKENESVTAVDSTGADSAVKSKAEESTAESEDVT